MSSTPSHKNRIVVASAGSVKSTALVDEVLSLGDKRVLVTTFTTENLEQLRSFFVERRGCVPANVTLISWYAFLLQDGARPYQSALTGGPRIRSIFFQDLPNGLPRVKKASTEQYYLTRARDLYRDRVAEFVHAVDSASDGQVVSRIEKVYDHIFVDEVQDLAGYDLEILDRLFASSVGMVGIGDPRQATFTTNRGSKNSQYSGGHGFIRWVKEREGKTIAVETRRECHRCQQSICDFADGLYPTLPATVSTNLTTTGHDGVFAITSEQVAAYCRRFLPMALRYNRKTTTAGLSALNFGQSKGRTFARTLIFPTKKMLSYLSSLDLAQAGDIAKFYVAVTRAQHSVAFVVPDNATRVSATLRPWSEG